MKVVFDHQIFSLQLNGGISRYIFKLYEGLNELGVEAIIKVSWTENVYLNNKKSFPKWVPWRIRQISYLVLNQLDDCIHPIRDIDVLHFTYYGQTPLRKYAKRTTVTIFDMIHENGLIKPSVFDTTIANKRKIVMSADIVLTISESTKSELLHYYPALDQKDVHVTYLGTDMSKYMKKSIKTKIIYQYILFVGNRTGYKNFLPYITAIAPLLQKQKLHIIAFGGGGFTSHEASQINDLGLSGLVDQVSGDDKLLAQYYKQALFLAYPSLSEGFGLPIIEAFALGCPVLTSNCSSMKEIGEIGAVFFDPTSTLSMQKESENLFGNSEQRAHLSLAGLQLAQRYPWRTCSKKTLQLYTNLSSI